MFHTLQTLLTQTNQAVRKVAIRRSPARSLMESAQSVAAHNPREAQDLRRAAMAQLSQVR
jgi:hypothetical protein